MTFFDQFCIIIIEVVIVHQSKFYNDYKESRDKAWEIIFRYGVSRLPVEIKELCELMKINLFSYHSGAEIIRDYKLDRYTANEGFSTCINDNYIIFYDESVEPHTRKRFTVAHEIGHIILGHLEYESVACRGGVTLWNNGNIEEPSPIETAANIFAARLLAPACVLHALDIHTAGDIAGLCGLSNTAAEIRAKRMAELYAREREWLHAKGRSCFGVSPQERRALAQFGQFIAEYKAER